MTRAAPAVIVLVLLVLVLAPPGDAHKGITSKYTYNADVYPVFLNRCGRCHIDGGVGPMSLLKYEDAFPWAESLRAELLTAYPGVPADLSADLSAEARSAKAEAQSATVDPHDFVKAAHRQILARELDIVLDWATGGTPEGDKAQTPPETSLRIDWASGRPDLVAQMPNRYHMNVTALEATHESALPIPTPSPVTVGRLDLLPGNPAIIRSAVLSLRSPDGTTPRARHVGAAPGTGRDRAETAGAHRPWLSDRRAHAIQENVEVRRPGDERSLSRRLVRRGLNRCGMRGTSVLIAGAGLAGLTAARELTKKGAAVTVIDARDRVGGRVFTLREPFLHGEHAEAGADLIDESQTEICTLIADVGLRTANDPAGRIHVGPAGSARGAA